MCAGSCRGGARYSAVSNVKSFNHGEHGGPRGKALSSSGKASPCSSLVRGFSRPRINVRLADSVKTNPHFYPIILAGGRGTRFWPLSRKRRAKQLLALDGKKTMIQQTVSRLLPLAPAKRFWVITNQDLHREVTAQLPALEKNQIIAEPVGRNTAPAIGLAAFILQRIDSEAVIGLFPSDHVIGDERRFRETLLRGIELAAAGKNIVVLGIRPTR